jgi:hypothetical protein
LKFSKQKLTKEIFETKGIGYGIRKYYNKAVESFRKVFSLKASAMNGRGRAYL